MVLSENTDLAKRTVMAPPWSDGVAFRAVLSCGSVSGVQFDSFVLVATENRISEKAIYIHVNRINHPHKRKNTYL